MVKITNIFLLHLLKDEMAHLAIFLFGGFRVTLDGSERNHLLSDKRRALLAFLAIESDRSHSRASLATMLWPDRPETISLPNLRQCLHRLRLALGDDHMPFPYLLTTSHEIQFNNRSDFWLDMAEFNRLVDVYQNHHPKGDLPCEPCLALLKNAIDLYRGDLMSGFSLHNCRQFEWWLLARQEEYHQQALDILDCLERTSESSQDYSLACRYAQRAIELEPWRERAHRQKMRALALSGQRCDALHQFEVCRRILAKELGVEPNAETIDLYQRIRTGAI